MHSWFVRSCEWAAILSVEDVRILTLTLTYLEAGSMPTVDTFPAEAFRLICSTLVIII